MTRAPMLPSGGHHARATLLAVIAGQASEAPHPPVERWFAELVALSPEVVRALVSATRRASLRLGGAAHARPAE